MTTNVALKPDDLDTAERVEIDTATSPDEALDAASGQDAVDIRFASFKDGRGFSLAAVLRARGYAGQLRAVGDLLPDQIDHLTRSGFDAVTPDKADDPRWQRTGFSHAYQPDAAGAAPAYRQRAFAARQAKVDALNQRYRDASPDEILAAAQAEFRGRIAMLSSFGTESAAGLALLARSAPDTPVLFLDTKRHFAQTLSYRDQLIETLGLKQVKILEPDPEDEARLDADNRLYQRDSLACCDIRKVKPLARGLNGYDVLITGRKRYHGGDRARLDPFEFDGERIKVNPFASLSAQAFAALFRSLDLPAHPLVAQGYPSVGCWPCTAPAEGNSTRDGRWAGSDRTECGIFDSARTTRARQASYRLI
ncbi:phosphoadenylyl-sulfate reductase [Marinicauda pacifica]|jgi:phosphoadenosine phosphosulfate reductase|uniref:phosphoadenylyl-sulfate reductase n=1 Tax=Marinicauda pacifica TaxID=1133559 RepID=UPI0035C7D07B